jgi:hypothetical protein
MTDFEIMELLDRQCSNWEKGAILRKAFDAQKPSVMNIKPQVQRKKREARQPKTVSLTNGLTDTAEHSDAH